MSMYAKYLKEKSHDEILETECGFASFRMINENKSVYIVDLYVEPDARNKKTASKLADEIVKIAKEKGAKELIGTVVPSAKGSTMSLKVLLGYGMHLFAANPDLVVFRKDI